MSFMAVMGALSLVIKSGHALAEMTGMLDDTGRKRMADVSRDEIQHMIDLLSAIQRGECIDAETLIPPGIDKVLADMGGQDIIDAANDRGPDEINGG